MHPRHEDRRMFTTHSPDGYRLVVPGVELRMLCYGGATMMTEFRLTAGYELPTHRHPQEQTGYLVRGRLRLRIGVEAFEAAPGDSWSIPGGAEHGATIIEDSVAVEVFSPVREDYLPTSRGPVLELDPARDGPDEAG
jgi:quercetin dioxygenase-like cupin family protein